VSDTFFLAVLSRLAGRAGAGYIWVMQSALGALVIVALIAVAAVLGVGLVSMLRGGEFNRKYGNALMRARVATQAAALVLLALYFLLGRE